VGDAIYNSWENDGQAMQYGRNDGQVMQTVGKTMGGQCNMVGQTMDG
jgi:hypothetical protein